MGGRGVTLADLPFAPPCDYHELPLVDGWHVRKDPEGWEGEQRIPCPLVAVAPGATGTPRKHRHVWVRSADTVHGEFVHCDRCHRLRDETRARRGKQARNYGTRAELA